MHARRTALRTLYRTLRALGIRAAAAAMAVQRQDLNIDTLANGGRPTGKRRRVMDRQSTD